ncbi:MAG: DUF1593 domain-containing protein [Candidatus Latescibacteria bacterium]|nr:DUF1593 domain-containing protein [Candidatus Latescibacterota bacterium]
MSSSNIAKTRLLILTDISNEPDDEQSLVRLLHYANEFDLEGLIATTSVWLKNTIRPERITERIEAYGQIRDNLLKHAPDYPSADYLHGITKKGSTHFGMDGVGAGQDSEGSDHIIAVVDQLDPRPLWIGVWGGPNTLAQALWKVRATRSPEEVAAFVAKLRLYAISDQDHSGHWLREEFPQLFYIVSPSSIDSEDYGKSTWAGISGDKFHGLFTGPDFHLVSNEWLDENVRHDHGPLAALYPWTKYLMEGDTPTFLYLIPNGLGVPEKPHYGSWGGRYQWNGAFYSDTQDKVEGEDNKIYTTNQGTIWRWRWAYQHDFAARVDWGLQSYEEANHHPVVVINGQAGKAPVDIAAQPGEEIALSAAGTADPDGDAFTVAWWVYQEAGTYEGAVPLEIGAELDAHLTVPDNAAGKEIHVICEVVDTGEPNLTAYRRVIVVVEE